MKTCLGSKLTARVLCLMVLGLFPARHALARDPGAVRAEIAPAQAQIEQGKKLLEAGQFAEAAALFEGAGATTPATKKTQKARIWAGIARAASGQIDQAIEHFDWVTAHGAGSDLIEEALYEKARWCERAGRTQDALAAIDRLRRDYPASDRLPPARDIEGRIQGAAPGTQPADAGPVQARIEQGRALFDAGDFAGAAAAFERAAAAAPLTTKGQKAKLWAGISHAWAGRIDTAIPYFDFAAARNIASEVSEQALYEKARFCARAGRTQEALAAVESLRIGYPESAHLLPALEVRGRLQGLSPEQIERVKAREREAAELVILARDKLRTKEGRPQVPGLADRIERDFSDTSAAIAVLPIKAEALHIQGRLQEAEAVYRQLSDRVVLVAPRSDLAVRAKLRVPYEMLHRAVQLCNEAIANPGSKDDAKVEAARQQCLRVLAMPEYDAKTAARARALLVEIEIFDNRPEAAETLGERFLIENYADDRDLKEPLEWVLVLHLSVAQAAAMQHKFEKALHKFEATKQLLGRVPTDRQANPNFRQLIERIYLQHVLALIRSDADRAVAVAAAEELVSRFPGSESAQVVRGRLGLPAK